MSLVSSPILWMLAATTVIQSFENVRMVDFQINMQFGAVFRYRLVTRIASFVATLALAFVLRSYWALILSTLITAVVTVSTPCPAPIPAAAGAGRLAGFVQLLKMGSDRQLPRCDRHLQHQLPPGLARRRARQGAVPGFIADRRSAGQRDRGADPPPTYAAFSRLLDDPSELARVFVAGFGFLFLVITPMALGIFATAPLIVPLALGPQWSDATAMIEAIVFYALFDAIGHYPQNLFIVLNRQPRLIALSAVFLAVRVPAAIYGGMVGGATGAVYGMAATALFGAVFWFVASLPLIDVTARAVWLAIWRTLVAGSVMVFVLLILRRLWPAEHAYAPLAFQLLAFMAVGTLLHIGLLLLLWRLSGSPAGAETRAIAIASRTVQRLLRMRLAFV